MERDGHPAAAAAATPVRRWAEDVIVLSSAGRPPPSSSEGGQHEPPPEKLYYKTKLCDKYEAIGRCMYEDGCTFAHGRAELRPPLPPAPVPPHHGFGAAVWRRPPPPGPDHDHQQHRAGGGGGYVKVCHNFRDRGSCHFGDKCTFPHASPAAPPPGGAPIRGPGGEQKLAAEARRSAAQAATAPRYAGAQASGRPFPPVPAAAAARDRLRQMAPEEEGGGGNASVLELLALRKTKGIYGDWPEQYS